jgi:trehalose 6-phosphate phosphatase
MPDSRPPIDGLEDFWRRVEGAARVLLALDYDGTLAPFQVDRMAAVPLPGMTASIEALRENPRVKLVMISGRALDELSELLGVPGVELIGSHGFEHQRASGERERTPLAPAQERALEAAEAFARDRGHRFERKAASVAVHSRGFDDDAAAALHAEAREAWRSLAAVPRMELMGFNGGVELRATGVDKGTALRGWLAEQGGVAAADVALYIGDDRTDEDAFAVLTEHGGLGVKVGEGETTAQGRVADCEAVGALLAALAATHR